MNYAYYYHIFLRCMAVLFWISILFAFLLVPSIFKRFSKKSTLNVLAWPSVIDASLIAHFEQETGIKVNVGYYEDNEQLFFKLRSGKESGYDLIMPSDYGADLLIKAGLVKKVDQTKLHFIDQIYPQLRGHFFDPRNEYTIPYAWSIFGIGIDKRYFGESIKDAVSWSLIFDNKDRSLKIGMPDDAREIAHMGAYYLFGPLSRWINSSEIKQLSALLLRQKKWVSMYTDLRADYLLISKTAPVVVALSSELARSMREYEFIDFLIPQEGTFIVIDTFAIPASTTNDEAIYKFLNYMYRPDVMQYYVDKFGFCPVLKSASPSNPRQICQVPSNELFSRLHFFNNIISEEVLSNLWIKLKS